MEGGNAVEPFTNYFGDLQVSLSEIPTTPGDSDLSTAHTIQAMTQLAHASSRSLAILSALSHAIPPTTSYMDPARRDLEDVRAIFRFAKRTVTFTQDEQTLDQVMGLGTDKELLISPDLLIQMPTPKGDCDDFSTLIAAMLIARGFPVWFVTIAADAREPDKFSHVYVKTWVDGKGDVYLDASEGAYMGWETPSAEYSRKKEWMVYGGNEIRRKEWNGGQQNKMLVPTGLGIDWNVASGIIDKGLTFAKDVLTLRPPPGQSIQVTDKGTAVFRTTDTGFPAFQSIPSFGGGVTPYLIFGGLGLIAILALSNMSRK